MKRSLVRVLAAALLVPLALVAAPVSADVPALSASCQARHNTPNAIISASGTITITADLNAGEQFLIVNRESTADVNVSAPSGGSSFSMEANHAYRYDVVTTGQHEFAITGTPAGQPASVTLDCGIPPTITGTDNDVFTVGDTDADFACHPGTNDIRACFGFADTSTAGSFSYEVRAQDLRGLESYRTFHYTVVKADQTLHFTTANPGTVPLGDTGVQIDAESDKNYTDEFGNQTLPVTISTDPNTPACVVNPLGGGPFQGNISTVHGGTCTVFADQPGDGAYNPAQRISMTFQIAKKEVVLTASKANKGIAGLTPSVFKAELKHWVHFGPGQILAGFPGQQITFWVNGKPVCTATTVFQVNGPFDTTAVATCKATIGLAAALTSSTYNATYSGNQDYEGAVATARLWL